MNAKPTPPATAPVQPIRSAVRRAGDVVVGVDGSPSSIGALQRGARLAEALGVPLRAVTTWSSPVMYGGYLGETFVQDSADMAQGAQDTLDDSVQAAFGDSRPNGFSTSIREGNAAETLIYESHDAEMLVVGSRGHGGFVGLLIGSVSSACAQHAACPVLVFHHEEPTAA